MSNPLRFQYGLYSAFMGCFVYCIFGSSKDITVGPTAIMALMTAEHANKGPVFAILLTFLSGIIILVLGLLNLGKICLNFDVSCADEGVLFWLQVL